jgi:hypothetical protein
MPNVRGDKRRTIVCPDDLWNGLGEYAAERSTTRGAVIREQIHDLLEDSGQDLAYESGGGATPSAERLARAHQIPPTTQRIATHDLADAADA